ncbi:Gfo/Idh/MocA family protein [Paludibaculum fermentans]|uniref:Gfo/Idh/MocA family oxidoreductase n=1 Tax=Paludibaculum fermentans TaxID=1473598 RepID=A0A7S7NXD4_PALFE|nr:Gfo/Idh/MocA family oxidoreductase [Paludibaculum fermentans]QOY91530.1 Gfo/Idh/MocA family oxidoreductase [Paludibaculum fermentans]
MTSLLAQSSTRSGLLTAAAVGALSAAEPAETLRVAVVGLGNRRYFLLTKLLSLPGVTIVADCDVNPAAVAAASQSAERARQLPAQYSDFRVMFDIDKSIQAVVMAVPDPLHKEIYVAVLEMGKHLYAEKPLALNVEDGRAVVDATARAGGVFQSGVQLRYDPARNAAVRFVQGGRMGRVLIMQGTRHGRDIPRHLSWHFDRNKSGDIIVDQGIHRLDMFTWIAGAPPLRAAGCGGRIPLRHRQCDDFGLPAGLDSIRGPAYPTLARQGHQTPERWIRVCTSVGRRRGPAEVDAYSSSYRLPGGRPRSAPRHLHPPGRDPRLGLRRRKRPVYR